MSKNLTRKGLALGALVALGASVIAGTPATAAPTALYVESAFGTSYTGVLGQYFVLAGSAAGATNNDVVKYYVEGVAAANVSAVGRVAATKTADATSGYGATVTETDVDSVAKQTTYATTITAGSYYELAIKINSTNVTSTTSIKVTPFLDSVVADGKPGTGELAGTPVTINFVKGSELTATPTITGTTFGSKATASVAVSGGVNLEQFRAAADGGLAETPFTVLYSIDGTDESSAQNALWDTTDKVLKASSSANAAAGKVYGATAKINGTSSASATAVTATAGEVASLGAITAAKGAFYAASANSSSDVLRAGAGSFKVTSAVTAVSGKTAAGQKVTFTVSEQGISTLAAGASVTAGGKSLANADTATKESFSVDVIADADGNANLEIAYTGLENGNKIDVSAKANGATAVQTASAVTYTGQDSVAKSLVDAQKSANASTVRRIAKGSAFSIAYQVVDQFGQVPSGTFRVTVSNNGGASITSPVAVSNGTVTVSGTDNSTADGTVTVTTTLQKLGSDGTTYAGLTSAISNTADLSVGTVGSATTVTLTAGTTTSVGRNGAALVAGNADAQQSSVDRTVANGSTISAVAKNASNVTVAGATVTFTAPGVLFKAGNVYGLGSITVVTDGSGATGTVNVYSNAVGKVTITAVSGSGSATQDYTFATPTTGGSAWNVTAPASVLPGTTLKVSAILVDKFGGVVNTDASKIKVVYTGPGYVTSTIANETDADGAVSFSVLLGAADTGSATVKFIYAGTNGNLEETTSNDDVVKTATIVIGAAAPAAATSANASASKGKINVAVTAAAGKTVVVKVGGKFATSFSATGSKKSVAVKAAKGAKTVTIYVGGKLVKTVKVTVK